MKRIGGNTSVTVQIRTDNGYDDIGSRVITWTDLTTLYGFLDMMSGSSDYSKLAKIEDSTHVFICDYVAIDGKPENKRLIHGADQYDVLYIDDPMGLHEQLEIYLKKVV